METSKIAKFAQNDYDDPTLTGNDDLMTNDNYFG